MKAGCLSPSQYSRFDNRSNHVTNTINYSKYEDKRDSSEAFKARFKGKTSLIGKEGHIGVAIHASVPINKGILKP
jgi:hypothetical protein